MIATASTPEEQNRMLLRPLTRKEAVLKASGNGIVAGLEVVEVWQGTGSVVRFSTAPDGVSESWWLV
jgi:phosphopantetheinyl transferase